MTVDDRKARKYQSYGFSAAGVCHMHRWILPQMLEFAGRMGPGHRVLDLGCGDGFLCGQLLEPGCGVVGIDMSEEGIACARSRYPGGRFEVFPADSELLSRLGEAPFDLALSTEVVEHLYSPRDWARCCHGVLKPGGQVICSTPFYGYAKNLALSLLGRWDRHADRSWGGGRIKFWSRRTLTSLLREVGFEDLRFMGLGRLPYLWMTMMISAKRPAN